ncbi:hypothetical protein E2C01_076716 [Portunus trituberculatus]|uniref:Uncharacterized protein n=1 Tax=Portunus trituberculatus TaxID=210409 RepID=A0A5B7I9E8_PORTR|nr:hypothetical protein [Portunus trituberculatus]
MASDPLRMIGILVSDMQPHTSPIGTETFRQVGGGGERKRNTSGGEFIPD